MLFAGVFLAAGGSPSSPPIGPSPGVSWLVAAASGSPPANLDVLHLSCAPPAVSTRASAAAAAARTPASPRPHAIRFRGIVSPLLVVRSTALSRTRYRLSRVAFASRGHTDGVRRAAPLLAAAALAASAVTLASARP